MQAIVFSICSMCVADPGVSVELDRPIPKLVVEQEFDAALETRILNAAWERVSLRTILRDVARTKQVSIILDRRIDPDQQPSIRLSGQTLRESIDLIAKRVNAASSVIGNCIYMGPVEGVNKLATLIEVRNDEIFGESTQPTSAALDKRKFELSKQKTVHWNDLDQPADLTQRIANQFGLRVTGVDQIPHDLWRGGTLPMMSAVESLSIVLIQFDKTFLWSPTGISIVSAPARITIERLYTPRGQSPGQAAAEWKTRFNVQAAPRGTQVVVVGSAEQHAEILDLVQPATASGTKPRRRLTKPPRIEFTLSQEQVPVIAVLQNLEKKGGFKFVYDKNALESAGVNLAAKVDINVVKASPAEFLKAVLDPIGVAFDLDGKTVTLRAK
ncbi:MAG: hypothetical protein O3A00_06850 [Planctomycetota bacterium]|nr:hypothetical protein [Planctomycetota bacterium]